MLLKEALALCEEEDKKTFLHDHIVGAGYKHKKSHYYNGRSTHHYHHGGAGLTDVLKKHGFKKITDTVHKKFDKGGQTDYVTWNQHHIEHGHEDPTSKYKE